MFHWCSTGVECSFTYAKSQITTILQEDFCSFLSFVILILFGWPEWMLSALLTSPPPPFESSSMGRRPRAPKHPRTNDIKGFVTRWIAVERLEDSMNGNGNQSHVSISMARPRRWVWLMLICLRRAFARRFWLSADNEWANGKRAMMRFHDANFVMAIFGKSLWSTKCSFWFWKFRRLAGGCK